MGSEGLSECGAALGAAGGGGAEVVAAGGADAAGEEGAAVAGGEEVEGVGREQERGDDGEVGEAKKHDLDRGVGNRGGLAVVGRRGSPENGGERVSAGEGVGGIARASHG